MHQIRQNAGLSLVGVSIENKYYKVMCHVLVKSARLLLVNFKRTKYIIEFFRFPQAFMKRKID